MIRVCTLVLVLMSATTSTRLLADSLAHFPTDSVIHLRKNTNSNQVHYEVLVDDTCRPLRQKTMHPYWRMYEKGPNQRARIMFWEQPGYGVRQPKSVSWNDRGGSFDFRIRGVSERVLTMETFQTDQGCRARAYAEINGEPALFEWIEIDVSGWANVHRVEMFGHSLATGEALREITHSD